MAMNDQSAVVVGGDRVASGGEVEPDREFVAEIARAFATVFDLTSVGPDDDFFALGGDSLIATALVGEIERIWGVSLTLSVLIGAATPRLLAGLVADNRKSSFERILIPVRPEGRGPAIFSVHGVAGDDLFTHRLAELLDQDRPLWTFRARGITAGEVPLTSIPAMADLYLAAVRSVQRDGPYIFMGHCAAGTLIAWEMARKLVSAGVPVAGAILLEPPDSVKWAPAFHMPGYSVERERAHARKASETSLAWIEANSLAPLEERSKHLEIIMSAAVATHAPRALECPTLLICRAEMAKFTLNPRNGYHTLLRNGRFFIVEGSHRDLLKDRLQDSIPEIRAFLDRVAPLTEALESQGSP